jgi:hypothetical protein
MRLGARLEPMAGCTDRTAIGKVKALIESWNDFDACPYAI